MKLVERSKAVFMWLIDRGMYAANHRTVFSLRGDPVVWKRIQERKLARPGPRARPERHAETGSSWGASEAFSIGQLDACRLT